MLTWMNLKNSVVSAALVLYVPVFSYAESAELSLANQNLISQPDLSERNSMTLSWSLGLEANHRRDVLSQNLTETVASAKLNFDSALNSSIDLKLYPRASMKNGYVQSVSASKPKGSTFEVAEASVGFHAEESARLTVGALNQEQNSSGLLLADIAFPAVQLRGQIGESDSSYTAVFIQGAVPTSSSLSSNSQDFEKTPTLKTAGLLAQFQSESWSTRFHGSYFHYTDLPSTIARDSGLLGNTITGNAIQPNSKFLYEYQGYDAGLSLSLGLSREVDIQIKGNYVRNQSAPESLNQGYSALAQLDLQAGRNKWSPAFEYFRIEPDAAVAYFNQSTYQTNRIGYETSLKYNYQKRFSVKASGGERNVIFESASQYREQFYSLSLETTHEAF